jgi:hypothetical protein
MKGRGRAQRLGAQRAAKRKQDYRMDLGTGFYALTTEKPRMTRRVPVPDDLLDRINRLTPDQRTHLRHYLKHLDWGHLAPPLRPHGRPKKTKPPE